MWTPQTERLLKMHAAQDETSGINWKEGAVLSSKTLPHLVCVRAPARFCVCAWPHLPSAAERAGGGREGGRKGGALFLKTIPHIKKGYENLARNAFIFTIYLFIYVKMSMGI